MEMERGKRRVCQIRPLMGRNVFPHHLSHSHRRLRRLSAAAAR
jgi:hypothetical protein